MSEESRVEPAVLTDPAKIRVTTTYNATADHFDDAPLAFWDRAGRGTVARLDLPEGATVLDVACGSGASALHAAERVGPTGRVVGVDLAERLLELARAKANALGHTHVEFRTADMQHLDDPDGSFDAVVCVFGVFFVEDMSRLVAGLWRLVRPGGQLAITTWGPRVFEPANTLFWEAVQRERPDLYRGFNPWDRINDTEAVREMLRAGGVEEPRVTLEMGTQPLRSPDDFWTIVLGTGYRGTVEQLDPVAQERVRQATLDAVMAHNIQAVETNFIYAIATRQ